MNHLVKIDVTIDTRDANQVIAFSNLLSSIGGISQTASQTASQVSTEMAENEKPKTVKTRSKKELATEVADTASFDKAKEVAEEELKADVALITNTYGVKETLESVTYNVSEDEDEEDAAGINIKIEDIRKLVAEKLADHRDTIKTKLGTLETKNVTNLPEKHYSIFHAFLVSLD